MRDAGLSLEDRRVQLAVQLIAEIIGFPRHLSQHAGDFVITHGGGSKIQTTEYLYYASFAVALSEGPITGIGRIWADGKPMDLSGITWRWYPGNETQTADPLTGAANTPAYCGTAYVVFEELPLSSYSNRLPQLSFEVFTPLADPDTAEGLVKAMTMIPASGEFSYAAEMVA